LLSKKKLQNLLDFFAEEKKVTKKCDDKLFKVTIYKEYNIFKGSKYNENIKWIKEVH
jgi:hypothetical protein